MTSLTADPYSIMVEFYDRWSARMTGDVEFYVRRATAARGPVIELGVGTGRIAIPIAQAGQRVIGVDRSTVMLTEGARRADLAGVAERITFVDGDMRTFVASEPVDLVIVPFRSFLHLLTSGDQLAALDSIKRSLRPGGRFICNVFTPRPHVIAELDGQRRMQAEYIDERGRRCEVWAENRYDVATQGIELRAMLEVYDGDRLADSTETTLHLRMVYRYEMEHLLARAGFEVEALYGGFDEEPYDAEPDEMIWVARRP